jgi:hypothetical protein
MIQRELSAIENLERVLKERKQALKQAQAPAAIPIRSVGVNCNKCGVFLMVEGVMPGRDGFAVCPCGRRIGAGWGADGVLSAYQA